MKTPAIRRSTLLLALLLARSLGPAVAAEEFELSVPPDLDYEAPAPGTYSLPVLKPAADGDVLDSRSRPHRLRDLMQGRVTVVSFIYTRCAATRACPYATGVLNQLHRASQHDAVLASRVRLISLSFDPANDTPSRMADYSAWAGGRQGAAEWQFLTTRSATELQPILEGYGQAVDRKSNPRDPTGPLNHTLRVFLVDAAGNIRNIYSSATLDPRLVLADIRTLLLEEPMSRAIRSTLTPRLTPDERASPASEIGG